METGEKTMGIALLAMIASMSSVCEGKTYFSMHVEAYDAKPSCRMRCHAIGSFTLPAMQTNGMWQSPILAVPRYSDKCSCRHWRKMPP